MLWLVILLLMLLLAPISIFCIEVILGCLSYTRIKSLQIEPTVKMTTALKGIVLVPAHNESHVISNTLMSLAAACDSNIKIIVIADNCTDDTKAQASQHSCEVIERNNILDRGKGYALAFGIQHCKQYNPDVVVIVDADCMVSSSTLKKLIIKAHNRQTIVQGAYRLIAPENANAKVKISSFAVFIKNIIRPLGVVVLSGSVPITGSGFAIPKSLLDQVNLASGEIVEDMKLGLDLVLTGKKVEFEANANISSLLPIDNQTTQIQRARWEHGHIGMIQKYVPKLFVRALQKFSWPALMTAMDLCVLPFIVLLVLSAFVSLVLSLLAIMSALPIILFFIAMLNLSVLLALMWANKLSGDQQLTLRDLYGVFEYAFSKVGLYTSLVSGNRSGWAKTKRDDAVKTKPSSPQASHKNEVE